MSTKSSTIKSNAGSTYRLTVLAAFVGVICQNWAELTAELLNCPLVGQEKMNAVLADYSATEEYKLSGETI